MTDTPIADHAPEKLKPFVELLERTRSVPRLIPLAPTPLEPLKGSALVFGVLALILGGLSHRSSDTDFITLAAYGLASLGLTVSLWGILGAATGLIQEKPSPTPASPEASTPPPEAGPADKVPAPSGSQDRLVRWAYLLCSIWALSVGLLLVDITISYVFVAGGGTPLAYQLTAFVAPGKLFNGAQASLDTAFLLQFFLYALIGWGIYGLWHGRTAKPGAQPVGTLEWIATGLAASAIVAVVDTLLFQIGPGMVLDVLRSSGLLPSGAAS